MPHLPDSGFDRAAFFYDRLAWLVFGRKQEEAQLALLSFIPEGATVLLIGGGSGWILQQVAAYCKPQSILYLDASPAMVSLAQKRFQAFSSATTALTFRVGTEAALAPEEQFDVIFTPFLLDLFPAQRLSRLMARLHAALAPGGRWLFADFWPVQQPPPRWQRLLLRSMYLFFGLVSGVKAKELPHFRRHFEAIGLQEKFKKSFYGKMIQAKVYQRA